VNLSNYRILLKTQGFNKEKRFSKIVLESGEIVNVPSGELLENPKTGELIAYGHRRIEIKI
jgi:hypothetical protein